MDDYKIFKKESYRFKPFVLEDKILDGAFEVTLSKYGSNKALSCGIFKMTANSFTFTYSNDEVMMILEGEATFLLKEGEVNLREGDIIQVREGLKSTISTKRHVKIFFVGFPVKSYMST
jgi:ethanolamine utilization protein EutQ (cupin superfamily)